MLGLSKDEIEHLKKLQLEYNKKNIEIMHKMEDLPISSNLTHSQDREIQESLNEIRGYEHNPWKTMDSAPKDGTRIIAIEDNDINYVYVTKWDNFFGWTI